MRNSFALVFFTLSMIATDAGAAKVQDGDLIVPTILFTGPIIKGDFEKFQKVASESVLKNMAPLRINLDSAGGDVDEAIKIGRLARKLLVEVWVHGNKIVDPSSPTAERIRNSISKDPSRATMWSDWHIVSSNQPLAESDVIGCYSACVFIFFGGTERAIIDNQDDRQTRRIIPVMGIHRPYYDPKYFSNLSPEEAAKEYKRLEILVEEYLKEMGAPGALMEKMLRKASNEVELVSREDFELFYRPVEPFLDEFLLAKCGSDADKEVLGPKELNDFERLSKARIQEFVRRQRAEDNLARNAEAIKNYVPDGFDANYAALLQEQVVQHHLQVSSCRNKAVLTHQIDWATAILRQR